MAPKRSEQASIHVVIQRAGTSKDPSPHEGDLPAPGTHEGSSARPADGLGGSRPVASEVAILSATGREDADVDTTFAQVDIASAGHRGDISSDVRSIRPAAASRIPESTVYGTADRPRDSMLRIGHPSAVTPAGAEPIGGSPHVTLQNLGFSRAARRLMDGRAHDPRNLLDEAAETQARHASA